MRKTLLAIGCLLLVTLPLTVSAATQVITATVKFITPISITNVINASFGYLTAGVASTTYVMDTAGNITTSSGPGTYITGTKNAASFTITGSPTQTINISSGLYTAQGGVTPSAATCKYGVAAPVLCDAVALDTAVAPGAGTPLLIGMTIAVAANIVEPTTATPTFTMTIVYN